MLVLGVPSCVGMSLKALGCKDLRWWFLGCHVGIVSIRGLDPKTKRRPSFVSAPASTRTWSKSSAWRHPAPGGAILATADIDESTESQEVRVSICFNHRTELSFMFSDQWWQVFYRSMVKIEASWHAWSILQAVLSILMTAFCIGWTLSCKLLQPSAIVQGSQYAWCEQPANLSWFFGAVSLRNTLHCWAAPFVWLCLG